MVTADITAQQPGHALVKQPSPSVPEPIPTVLLITAEAC
jgi:hypothetical protein